MKSEINIRLLDDKTNVCVFAAYATFKTEKEAKENLQSILNFFARQSSLIVAQNELPDLKILNIPVQSGL